MGFNEEYLKLRKKRLKDEENGKTREIITPYRRPLASDAPTSAVTDDDIAPVTWSELKAAREKKLNNTVVDTTEEKEPEEKSGWFKASDLWKDGYQFGDVLKSIGAVGQDVVENVGEGIIGMGEAVVDGLLTIAPYVSQGQYYANGGGYNLQADEIANQMFEAGKKGNAELVKKDLYDEEKVAKAILSEHNPISYENFTGREADADSVLGEKTDSLAQSGGQLAATAALQAVGVPWWLTTGATAFGSESENALNQGATMEEAALSGAISAGAEILTEKLSGGISFGSKTADDVITKELASTISNKAVRALAKAGVDMVGEGGEEVASQFISNLGSSLYREENLGEILASEEALDGYIDSFIGGAVLGGGSSAISSVQATIKGEDAVTGLKTDTEQKVVDKLYKDAIAEAEADGTKLTHKEKSKIYDSVLNNLEKGYISTDVIEEVLGGEDYKTYKNEIKRQQDLDNELNELRNMKSGEMSDIQTERMAELKAMTPNTEMVNALKFGIDEKIRNGIQGTKLAESYNEKARRGQTFEADLSKYDEKQAAVVQKAIDSGILNNTNRTHEFVDMVSKISADKGVLFDFTNNEKLKGSSFAVDGKTVNGFVTKDGVTLNIDSAKSLNSVVGHEITHVLEGTELYTELSSAITEYAKAKGDYQGRYDSLSKLYEGVDGADIDAELTADLVGDYLFTDQDFINNLSTEHRNVFQKIYDEIKYLYKVATAGSKEARELEKVKKVFEQAYKQSGKAKGDTKYSLTMVDPVKPTSGKWAQSATTDEVRAKHPTLYAVDETATEKRNPTQVKGTVGSYRNIYESLKAEGFNGTILDASSGLGLGTKVGVEEYGFNVDDIEPYPDSSYKPKYTDYSALEKKYDVVISNAVLNVLPQDQRDALVAKMGETLNPGGRMFVNVRGKDVLNASGKIAINEANMEYFIPRTEKTGSYQKGFTRAELKAYLEDALGEGYKVEPTKVLNGVSVVVTKDGGAKYSLSDSDGKQLTKEQSDYFKDSKMRDDNGNLKVMYHGSQDAGFHVFDPSMSDDGISLFFVDSNDVAASYSGTSETYEAQTIKTAEDMNNFIESIGAEGYEVVEKDGKFTLLYEGDRVADSKTAKGIYKEFCWYEGVGEGDANYKVYLNLTNPLEIDAKGRPWNKIDAEFSQEIYDKYNSLTPEEKAALVDLAEWEDFRLFNSEVQEAQGDAVASAYAKMGEDCNIYDLFSVAADNFSEESMRENARGYLKTRDYAQRAKEGGYDGVIFKNIHDNGGYSNGDEGASTVAIAFNSEQVKSVANDKPTKDPDIRYSLAEQDTKTLNKAGLEYDAKSETVSFSLSSLEDAFDYNKGEADYQAAREDYVNALAKSIAADKGKPTAEEKMKASKYLDGLFLIHDMIAADKDRLDYAAAVDKSAWVSNSEYGGSIDFSTLCAKRRLFTGTFDAIQNALPDTVLDENDFLRIRDMLLEKELESPCSMCYVEGSRAKHGVYVDKWLKEYLATNPEWKPQIADFTSSTRLERTRIEHPEAYAEYQKAMNKLAQRKPKEASVRTDYKGEILVAFADGSSVEIKNQNGGIRFNSFSDFEIIHALDCMQVITDMARVGLNGQAYTKVKEFAESFGGTGLKINLSLVAKDVDANGKLIMDEVNGMKYSEAMDIRNKYSDNVGTVIVVFNDAQVKAALADPTIDFVLPFHRSQWKKSQYTMMGLPTVTKDYTALQNDRIKNPKTGKPVKLSKLKQATTYTNDITGETYVIKDNIMPNMYWDYSKSGRDNANRYLDYINANGMTPKFDFLLDKVNGKWTLPEGAVGDGYFKLLIDFKMYNNEGWGAPQNPVLPEFNMPYIQQMLDNYIGGHQSFPVAHDVVDKFVEGKKNGSFSLSERGNAAKPDIRYSLSEYTAEEKKAHNDAVVKHFGKTYKWAETGYLLLDGTKLDLSGKHDGAPGGYRTVDHRDITEALGYDYGGGEYSDSLIQFMSEGNIRIIPEIDGINLSVKPTKAQEQALTDYISRVRGEVVLDIDDLNGYTVVSVEYPSGTRSTKILNDIREWFDNGIKPENNLGYSLTKEGDTPKRYGTYNVYGKDIGLAPMRENIAPVDEAVDEAVAPVVDEVVDKAVSETYPEDFTPIPEAQANAMQSENIDSLTDADAPREVEAPYYGESENVTPADPFANRDIKAVGNPKVKAYVVENPDVLPFFQEAANAMLGDLQNTVRGERHPITDADGYISGWDGTKRQTTDDIAYLLDALHYNYGQIESALNAIIEGNGKYNAAAKKIEFLLNDRLMKGYTDISGYDIPPNQDYLNLLSQKQTAEAVTRQGVEAAGHITDAPIVPVAEKYEAIRPQREQAAEAEPRMKRADTPSNAPSGMEERRWYETSTGSEAVDGMVTPDDIPDDVRYYQVKSNQKTLDAANARLARDGYAKSREYFEGRMSERKLSVEDIALGERLIQEAAKAGDAKAVRDLIIDVSILGTELGQRVQALSMIRRLTPEGQLKTLHRMVERGKAKGDKAFRDVEVTDDMTNNILKTYKEDGTFDQADLDRAVEDAKQKLADQMSVGAMDYVNAWRYLSMLGNPKTHIRNVVSNVAMMGTRAVKNAVARSVEDIALRNKKPALNTEAPKAENPIAPMRQVMPAGTRVRAADRDNIGTIQSFNPQTGKYTVYFENEKGQNATVRLDANILKPLKPIKRQNSGKTSDGNMSGETDIAPVNYRTKTWARATDAVKVFAKQTMTEMDSAIKGDTKYSEEASIKAKRQIFKTKAGNWMANTNNTALEWEDAVFSKHAFKQTLQEYLTANGIKTEADIKNNPEIVEKAKDYALEEARRATFRQDSYLANKISEIEKKNGVLGVAVGSIMPFKKTPINIAKTGLAYSPLGFARNIYDAVQVKKGNMDASEAVDHLAQTLTGTSLTLIGFALASAGLLNGAGEDDKEGKYDYQLGEQSYSFNFGGDTYSLSWLSPVAMPLFVGANAYEKLVEKEEWDMNVVIDTLAQTLDPLSEMSFLSSLDDVLSSYDSGIEKFMGAGESMVQNYATQFVPTLSSQVAATFDDTKRSTAASRDSSFKFGEETVNKIKYKIPGLRNTLAPTTDIWGNEAKQTENVVARGFESFFSPANKRAGIATAVDEELKALYGETDDSGVLPAIPQSYINYDGERYDMSTEEYTEYKKLYGQTAYDLMEKLFNTETYKNATSEERAEMVNRVYDYARDNAKREYFAGIDLDFTNATKDGKEVYKENSIVGAINADLPVDEYEFSTEYPEKYKFFKDNDLYQSYKEADEDGKRAYNWAFDNPGKYTMSKAFSDDFLTFYGYRSTANDIKGVDENGDGRTDSGTKKANVIDWINGLNELDYGQKIILYRSMYNSKQDRADYNMDIVDYLNDRGDISYEQMKTILEELGMTVDSEGNISWD